MQSVRNIYTILIAICFIIDLYDSKYILISTCIMLWKEQCLISITQFHFSLDFFLEYSFFTAVPYGFFSLISRDTRKLQENHVPLKSHVLAFVFLRCKILKYQWYSCMSNLIYFLRRTRLSIHFFCSQFLLFDRLDTVIIISMFLIAYDTTIAFNCSVLTL